jgi:asparagine synthase (glutamine-hydrolysing)
MASRGPDASGSTFVDGLTFGHQRLAIIGLGPEGAQPMATDRNHVLVFNGEIYNFREIAHDLGIAAESDTQVLYEIGRRHAWPEWIDRLRGMFAFVHYSRSSGTLTVARDPFGIKPLYVRTHSDGELSFASTVAALAALEEGVRPDSLALTSFLAGGVFSQGSSAFASVKKVEPGIRLSYQRVRGGWRSESAPINGSGWPVLGIGDAIHDSVRAHLVADVEVGVLLSGGVDSTLLAAIAAKMTPGVRTFCLTNPDNPEIDEAALARHNAGLLGTTHVEVPVTPATLADRANVLIKSTGEPFSDAAYLPLSALAEVVSQHVKVALAGEGADELFGGYRRYDLERLIDSRVLGAFARGFGHLAALDRRFPYPSSQRDRALHASALQDPAGRHASLMFGVWADVRKSFEYGEAAHDAYLHRWGECATDPWALGQPPNRAYDTREWLPSVFLEKSDRASMLHSLELRTPYLDPVVARAAYGYNPSDCQKQPLRDELHRLLPGVELQVRKKGLSVDTSTLVTRHYAELVRRTVLDPASVLTTMGLHHPQEFLKAVGEVPTLAFRVAMVGLWQENWL